MKMIFKILKKTKIEKEYLGIRKIVYEDGVVTVINYNDLISINSNLIDLKDLVIKGEELKVIYQDPVRIKLKGNIKEVLKNEWL